MHVPIARASILAALLTALPAGALAQRLEEPSLEPEISGHVNATYNFNLIDPEMGINRLHGYDAEHNTFLLDAAHLALTGSDERIAYAVEIDAGSDAAVTSGDDDIDVQEAWLSYASAGGLGFRAGKFATFHGIEVIESPANPTVSRGLLFTFAQPFTHVGAVASYRINPTFDVAAGAVSGWDRMVDNNDGKTLVARVGVNTTNLSTALSAYAGPEQDDNDQDWRYSADLSGLVRFASFDLWFQLVAGMERDVVAGMDGRWIGAGLQPVFRLGEKLTLGTRVEVFADQDGARTGTDQTILDVSIAPALAVYRSLVLRAEARLDRSTDEVFTDVNGETHRTQIITMVEALVTF